MNKKEIDNLKNLGLFTQVLPAENVVEVCPDVDSLKEYLFVTVSDPSESIEEAIAWELPAAWDYIWNEETWNAAYNKDDSALKKYYDANPTEDLWNPEEGRPANFNDRVYECELYSDLEGESPIGSASYKATWGDPSQLLTDTSDPSKKYYINVVAGLDGVIYEMFYDDARTESAGMFLKILSISFPDCIHCWEGSVKAPGAKYPWCVVAPPTPFEGSIKFVYEGGDAVWPWGEAARVFGKGYAIASIPVELGEQYLLDEDGNTSFKPEELVVTLVKA